MDPVSLERIPLPEPAPKLPASLQTFLDEAEDRIEDYQYGYGEQLTPLFQPAEYPDVVEVLIPLIEKSSETPVRFLEWGCGFGVVATAAAQLGCKAVGIEREQFLIDQAQLLAQDFDVQVQWIPGDFMSPQPPPDAAPDAFDLIYAYPWPKEATPLFKHAAQVLSPGTLLLTYHGFQDIQLHQQGTAQTL